MEKNTSEELLDVIASKANCSYLSDVALPIYKEKVLEALERIDEEEYGVQEWQEVVNYIVGENIHIENGRQAKEYLKQKLWKRQF